MENKKGNNSIIFLIIIIAIGYFLYQAFFTPDKNVDLFSHSYTEFRNAEFDAGVNQYVPIIDFSKETPSDTCPMCGKANFWTALATSLDSSATSYTRLTGAHTAIDYYNSYNSVALGKFSGSVSDMNQAVVNLVQIANQIKNQKYREDAIKVATSARLLEQDYQKMYDNEDGVFNAQVKTVNHIIDNNGMLYADYTLKTGAETITKLMSERDTLQKSQTNNSQSVQDAFATLKGETSLIVYPSKMDSTSSN